MSLRQDWLNMFIKEVSNGGYYTGLHRLYDHNAMMYLYLSYAGKILNMDAAHTFFYVQLIFVYMCAGFYPVIFYRLTHNIFVSVGTMFYFKIYSPYSLYLHNDSYWVYAWITYLAIPVFIFLFAEKWKKSNWIWVAFLVSISAVSNVFRSSASICVVFFLIILMLVKHLLPAIKQKSFKKCVAAATVCAAIFLSQNLFTLYVPVVYQKYTGQPEVLPLKGPWHSIYIGLGWEENPDNIIYNDGCGYAGRENLLYNTHDGYYIGVESPGYIETMKHVYLDTVTSNIPFYLKSYIRKLFTGVETAFSNTVLNFKIYDNGWFYNNNAPYFVSAAGILCAFAQLTYALFKKDRRKLTGYALGAFIIFVFAAVGLLPGVIATPVVREYIFASCAAMDAIILFAFASAIYTIYIILVKIFSKIYSGILL